MNGLAFFLLSFTAVFLHEVRGQSNSGVYMCAAPSSSYNITMTPNSTVVIYSHETFDEATNYPNSMHCVANIKRGTGCQNVSVQIPFFHVTGDPATNCKGTDFVELRDQEDKAILCGNGAGDYNDFTADMDFNIIFDSTKGKTDKGFMIMLCCNGKGKKDDGDNNKGGDGTCLCGIRRNTAQSKKSRIIGGKEAEINEFPWQAGIMVKSSGVKPVCGGTVIAKQWVMTAAHCMFKVASPTLVEVDLGDHDVTIFTETQDHVVGVLEIHNNPNYNQYTQDNDFSLLKLDEVLDFTQWPNIRPICYPTVDPEVGATVTITGWGTLTEGGVQPNSLQKLDVPIVSNEQCLASFPGGITSNMICAGNLVGGQDACQGDSGGPMVYNNNGNYELTGVISFGNGCAKPGTPGVYAKVMASQAWWQGIIGSTEACPRQ